MWFTEWVTRPPSVLNAPAGLYRGYVEGIESGRGVARIKVRNIPGGCVTVDYEAVGADGLQHAGHTVVTADGLFVAHSEATGVHLFNQTDDGVFDASEGGPYSQRLVVGWDGQQLTWAWHWSPAGEPLRERSRATARLAPG